jgi:hypothetical protein
VLAGFMLAVFAFSITPKIILHNVVANHKDTPFASNFEKNAQFSKAGFNCSCDNLVVESPFTDDYDPLHVIINTFYPAQIIKDVNSFDNTVYFYPALRGPPAFHAA